MEDILLKISAGILVLIVILIFIQYLTVLKKQGENKSSLTVNNLDAGNEIINTKINHSTLEIKTLNSEKERLMQELAEKLKLQHSQQQITETFEEDVKCEVDSTKHIYYLYLTTALLETARFKPQPIWTNELFCVYKLSKILSLDDSLDSEFSLDVDYYYPLGDIILLKNYDNYLKNYVSMLGEYQKKIEVPKCVTPDSPAKVVSGSGPSVTEEKFSNMRFVENFESTAPKGDTHISNYNQPGLGGLKMLVKNGKKPLGFEPKPVCAIQSSNGESLYVWKPIAPEGYVFLGDVCTIGITAQPPLVDNCHIRCIPKECVDNVPLATRALLVSADILRPYKIYTTSNGKYFQGLIDNGLGESIQSYDLNEKCLNIERDEEDNEASLDINIVNTDGNGGSPANNLTDFEFNSFKLDFLLEIEKKLLGHKALQLNNVLNNKNMEPLFFQESNMRFKLDANSMVTNQIILKIELKKRAVAYNELTSAKLIELINSELKNIFKMSLRINGSDYNFEATSMVSEEKGLSPEVKLLITELEKAVKRLQEEIDKGKIKLKDMEDKHKTDMAAKDTAINEQKELVKKLEKEVAGLKITIEQLKKEKDKALADLEAKKKELVTSQEQLKKYTDLKDLNLAETQVIKAIDTLLKEGKGTKGELDETYKIDKKLRDELETLGRLALRSPTASIDLNNLVDFGMADLDTNLLI